MFLKTIFLKNFRLHKETKLQFSDNLNYIVGGNGQGKTTLLEAIYYLCTTKSLNQAADSEVVNFSEKYFEIEGRFSDRTDNKVKVFFDLETNKKNLFVDEKQIYRSSSFIGSFPVVALMQSDHAITQGSPGERRRFVDQIISQASSTYLNLLLDYNRILRQRSSLLSQIKEFKNPSLFDQLDVWTSSLIKIGSELIRHRIQFVEAFNEYIYSPYNKIMGSLESPKIEYIYLEANKGDIEKTFSELIEKRKKVELIRGRNLVGPHRDDFEFTIGGVDLKKFGSQGQHKTFQIALRFSQFFYIKDKLEKTPVFLMDDVFGELDSDRAGKISEYLNEVGQAFITMTDLSNIDKLSRFENDLCFKVFNGNVINA